MLLYKLIRSHLEYCVQFCLSHLKGCCGTGKRTKTTTAKTISDLGSLSKHQVEGLQQTLNLGIM